MRGEEHYIDFLSRLHATMRPSLYLEIGVRFGRSLALADGQAVGVDPQPDLRHDLGSKTRVWTGTSDLFFESADQSWLPAPVDLAFLDGMHLFEYVLRDFMNTERRSRPGATIVIDDVFPVHPAQAARSRRTKVWTGDVWKIDAILARYRPDLVRIRVDTQPTGLLLVVGANPANTRLWQEYNPILRAFSEDLPVPEQVLDRTDALPPTSPQLADALELIADRGLRRPELIARLRDVLTRSHQ